MKVVKLSDCVGVVEAAQAIVALPELPTLEFGLCHLLKYGGFAKSVRYPDAYAVMGQVCDNQVKFIGPEGKWTPLRYTVLCTLAALTPEELYTIVTNEEPS